MLQEKHLELRFATHYDGGLIQERASSFPYLVTGANQEGVGSAGMEYQPTKMARRKIGNRTAAAAAACLLVLFIHSGGHWADDAGGRGLLQSVVGCGFDFPSRSVIMTLSCHEHLFKKISRMQVS